MAKKKKKKKKQESNKTFVCQMCGAKWQLNTTGCPNCGSGNIRTV